jgi:hypothetical protein
MLKYHSKEKSDDWIEKPQKWGEKFLGSILKQKSPFHIIVSRLLSDITKTFFCILGQVSCVEGLFSWVFFES